MNESLPQRKHLTRIPVWLPADTAVIYFITACCADRRPVFAQADHVCTAIECLRQTERRLRWRVLNCCFMPDHVHLLLSPVQSRDQPPSKFMQRWKNSVTVRLKPVVGHEVWQREFFDRLLRTDEKLDEKWNYIRENPVRAGLCSKPEDYPFSGTPEEILLRLDL